MVEKVRMFSSIMVLLVVVGVNVLVITTAGKVPTKLRPSQSAHSLFCEAKTNITYEKEIIT